MLAIWPMVWKWCREILFLNLNLTVLLRYWKYIYYSPLLSPPEQHCACDRQSEMASDSQLSPASWGTSWQRTASWSLTADSGQLPGPWQLTVDSCPLQTDSGQLLGPSMDHLNSMSKSPLWGRVSLLFQCEEKITTNLHLWIL